MISNEKGLDMEILVVLDHRFERTPDGRIWSWAFHREYWERFLRVFDRVRVFARIQDVSVASANARLADSANIVFVSAPFYRGSIQFVRRYGSIHRSLVSALQTSEAVLLRSGLLAICAGGILRCKRHPYGVEMIGDPYDGFAPHMFRHPLRPFFRVWFTRQFQILCRNAATVIYVTEYALQKRYPAKSLARATACSDVNMKECAYASQARGYVRSIQTLLAVGTMDMPAKGHDVLLRALLILRQAGVELKLRIAGDGRRRPALEALAAEMQLSQYVEFLGMVAQGDAVRAEMDAADLFVLTSRTEGLPRALIEAMGRGMPCVATRVGGIPELLKEEDLIPPGDAEALADKLKCICSDIHRLSAMSVRNFERSKAYADAILSKKREGFYSQLRGLTENYSKNTNMHDANEDEGCRDDGGK